MSFQAPDVTVVIPVYNRQASIGPCIESVLAQVTRCSVEIVVVDDGSTDATVEHVVRYRPPVKLLQQAQLGPGAARNAGVAAASSDIVAFLDSDDVMLPGRLEKQHTLMQARPDVVLTFGAVIRASQPNQPYLSTLPQCEGWSLLTDPYGHLMTSDGECISTMTAAVRKPVFQRVGGFNEALFCGEDTDLWIRLGREGPFAYTGEALAIVDDLKSGDRLTKSPYVYLHGPLVMLRALQKDQWLTAPQRERAKRITAASVNMMLRYDWTHNGGKALRELRQELEEVFGPRFVAEWRVIHAIPPALGRFARNIRSRLRERGSS